MIPMCIGDATFRASATEKPTGRCTNRTGRSEGHCAHGALVPPRRSRYQSKAQNEAILTTSGGAAEPMTRWSRHHHTAIVKARVRQSDGKPSIDLVVRPRNPNRKHLGKTVSLGRYATDEFAAKAAAVYFAKHPAKKTHSPLASSAVSVLSKK